MTTGTQAKIFETSLSTMWFDEEGIFHSVTKPKAKLDKAGLVETFEYIRKHAKDKKICWLGDVTNASFPTDEARDYAGEITPTLIKALALVTNSEISNMIANVFLVLKKPPYPTKLFTSEKAAKEWLKHYL